MSEYRLTENVREYRQKCIEGDGYNLVPVDEKSLSDIVKIRNQEDNIINLSLSKINLADQERWFMAYKSRNNDLYWLVNDRNGQVQATVRLNDITEIDAEIGSLVINQECKEKIKCFERSVKLAAEVAFHGLKLKKLWATVPVENVFIHKLDYRLGFELKGQKEIRGKQYDLLEISADKYFWKTEIYELLKQRKYELISERVPRQEFANKITWIKETLFHWLSLKQQGINIIILLREEGVKSIAIYGMGVIGEQLAMEALEVTDVKLKYIIDRRPKRYQLVDSYTPDDELVAVDAIVITCQECENVKSMLSKKIDAKIIHINELIERNEVHHASN